MTNNKTVIPGISEQSSSSQQGQGFTGFSQQMPPFGKISSQTVFPGVAPSFNEEPSPKGQLLGFLFSVSKTMAGEYWPLYLGANTIGRGSQNSIQLLEATVSDVHANIHIISRSGKMFAILSDSQSKTGVLLNNELLIADSYVKNGDIITIGESYELYVLLLNVSELNLKEKESFKSVGKEPSITTPSFSTRGPIAGMKGGNATVLDGQSGPVPMGGHTVVMGGFTK